MVAWRKMSSGSWDWTRQSNSNCFKVTVTPLSLLLMSQASSFLYAFYGVVGQNHPKAVLWQKQDSCCVSSFWRQLLLGCDHPAMEMERGTSLARLENGIPDTGKHKNIWEIWRQNKGANISSDPLPLQQCNPYKWMGAGICLKELIFINNPRMPFSSCTTWFKGFQEKQHTINQRAALIGSNVKSLKTVIPSLWVNNRKLNFMYVSITHHKAPGEVRGTGRRAGFGARSHCHAVTPIPWPESGFPEVSINLQPWSPWLKETFCMV